MSWRRRPGSRLRSALLAALLLLAVLAAARIHACACTGGRPEWRPVYPTTEP